MKAIHFVKPKMIEEAKERQSPSDSSNNLQLHHLRQEQKLRMKEGGNAMMIKNEFGANMSEASVNV